VNEDARATARVGATLAGLLLLCSAWTGSGIGIGQRFLISAAVVLGVFAVYVVTFWR
jgi:hypothetical protein